jgi:hypothetical protein
MIKTFEELRSHIWDERQGILEHIAENMEESTAFTRGKWSGHILAYEDILSVLRNSLKYGEPPEELE